MLRLLVTTSTFPISKGPPMPRFVLDMASALTAGCEVTVLAPGAPDEPGEEKIGEVGVRRFTYFLPRRLQRLAYGSGMRDNLRGSLLAKVQVPFFLMAQLWALMRLLKRKDIQIVNSHWMIPQGFAAAILRRWKRSFRHVLHVHAADVYMLRKLPFGRGIARYVMRGTDFTFADGSHVRDTLDELLGYPSGAVLRPMGVDTSLFGREGSEEPVATPFEDGYLLFFGRFSEKKGVEFLLRAMPRILEEHPGMGLVLIGYGALEEQLRRLAEDMSITDKVQFAGGKPHEEIVRYLHGCRAAVVPSVIDSRGETDGMPTVVVEALSAGVRVVASAVDGIPDVIEHGVNGWLCREKDPGDLAEKVLVALDDFQAAGVDRAVAGDAGKFDWKNVAVDYMEAFKGLAPEAVRA